MVKKIVEITNQRSAKLIALNNQEIWQYLTPRN
jgi:hypothetical protein